MRALQDWLKLAGIGEGAVFRPINRHERLGPNRLTGHAVAVILKRRDEGLAASAWRDSPATRYELAS